MGQNGTKCRFGRLPLSLFSSSTFSLSLSLSLSLSPSISPFISLPLSLYFSLSLSVLDIATRILEVSLLIDRSICSTSSPPFYSSPILPLQVTATELLSNKPSSLPSVQPFHALIYPFSLREMLEISRKYAAKARMNVALTDTRFSFKQKATSCRLKIGYVSSDFGNHPLSQLMQSGM